MLSPQETAEVKRQSGLKAYRARLIDGALRLFDEAVALDPSNVEAHADYGVALLRKYELTGNTEFLSRGTDELKRVTELATRDRRLYLIFAQIGEACDRLGRREEAREALLKAIELYPDLSVPDDLRERYLARSSD